MAPDRLFGGVGVRQAGCTSPPPPRGRAPPVLAKKQKNTQKTTPQSTALGRRGAGTSPCPSGVPAQERLVCYPPAPHSTSSYEGQGKTSQAGGRASRVVTGVCTRLSPSQVSGLHPGSPCAGGGGEDSTLSPAGAPPCWSFFYCLQVLHRDRVTWPPLLHLPRGSLCTAFGGERTYYEKLM